MYLNSFLSSLLKGKERLFLEVARVLREKIYINPSKLKLLECLGFSKEDMQWFTVKEEESHIHVVPLWTLASFKRLKHISNRYTVRNTSNSVWLSKNNPKKVFLFWLVSLEYEFLGEFSVLQNRFSLIVAFSPTGWTSGKTKKKSPGRRLQQGTIIR